MNVASELLTPLPPIGLPLVASLQHVAAELAESVGAEQIGEAVADAGIARSRCPGVAVVAVRTGDDPQFRAVHTRGLSGVARRRVAAVPADGGGFIAKVGRSREALFLHSVADAASPPSRMMRRCSPAARSSGCRSPVRAVASASSCSAGRIPARSRTTSARSSPC